VACHRDSADAAGRQIALVDIVALGDLGHGARSFARSQDQKSPRLGRRRRQMRDETVGRVRGCNRGTEQLKNKITRRSLHDHLLGGASKVWGPLGSGAGKFRISRLSNLTSGARVPGGPALSEVKQGKVAVMAIDEKTRTELEAAAFRRLVAHLQSRGDVQNIDLMNLAGFCRNCLSNWMKEAADQSGVPMSKDESREAIYGMPFEEWKAKHQREASAAQLATFAKSSQKH
jgi:hypothetical protein